MTDQRPFTPLGYETIASSADQNTSPRRRPVGIPSNEVYARVGDSVLQAAQDGVRRGIRPQDIIREIVAAHGVHLSVGELRLLLASRRLPPE